MQTPSASKVVKSFLGTFQNILRRKKNVIRNTFFFEKMLEIFSKIVEKYNQNLFFRPISGNIFLGTNQMILNFFFFTFKKKKVFDEKMFVN